MPGVVEEIGVARVDDVGTTVHGVPEVAGGRLGFAKHRRGRPAPPPSARSAKTAGSSGWGVDEPHDQAPVVEREKPTRHRHLGASPRRRGQRRQVAASEPAVQRGVAGVGGPAGGGSSSVQNFPEVSRDQRVASPGDGASLAIEANGRHARRGQA